MKNAVVQGASRGIGLGVVRHLIERGSEVVHATCRDPETAHELLGLRDRAAGRVVVHRLDVTDETSISNAAAAIRERTPQVHLLFNTSGILHGEGQKPERRLEELDKDRLLTIFAVNAIGPLLVVKHLFPALAHDERAVVASLSARVGSIGDNRRGGWYGYRSSKAALNQLHKSLAVELGRRAKNAISVVLHPGTVETRLTEPFRKSVPEGKLFSVDHSVSQLLSVIDGLSKEDHGGFFDYAKQPIEW
jgi:NAD(P)-dependent dehydrogenase (short-subunit alcohol dehydrogenase family)